MSDKEKVVDRRTIRCGFCGEIFDRLITKGMQVRCPDCLRFVPTYKKELTNNLTGRKHIHTTNT